MANKIYNMGESYKEPIYDAIRPTTAPEESSLTTASQLPNYAKLNVAVGQKYEAPAYEDKYGSQVDSLLSSMQNRGAFSYNPETDPAYQAYRTQYLREGQRATKNTMATAAAATGGIPSSYAVSAAAQAGNNYSAQLTDKIPELYQQAYNRYLQEFQNQAQMTQLYQNQQAQDYNRYSQDRSFGYQANQDWLNNMMQNQQNVYNMKYNDRAFNYQQKQDWINNMQKQQQNEWSNFMQQAQMAYQVGDYNQLKAMGFDVSRANFGNDLSVAQLIAQYTGDTSALRALMNR